MHLLEIKKAQNSRNTGNELNRVSNYAVALKMSYPGESMIKHTCDDEDFFLENEPVYIGKFEAEILLKLSKKQEIGR